MAHPYNETLSYPPSSYDYSYGNRARSSSRRRSSSRTGYSSNSRQARNFAEPKTNGLQKARVLIGLLQILAGVLSIWTIREGVRRVKEDRAAAEGARKREDRRQRERDEAAAFERGRNSYFYGDDEEELRRRQRLEWERWQFQQAHGGSIAWDGRASQEQEKEKDRGLMIDEKAFDWGSRSSAGSGATERDRRADSDAERRRRRRRNERGRRNGDS